MSRLRISNTLVVALVATQVVLATGTPILAQSAEILTPGDVVRINYDFVGTLMSIERSTLTVIGAGEPTCWPGIGHGDAPRCDPAPSVRRVIDWRGATVERQLVGQSHAKRTAVGFLIGAALMAPIGYATGPSLGYGQISACVAVSDSRLCAEPILREEKEALQRARDQKRGAFFFSLIGGSLGAIIARRMADDWLMIQPPASFDGDGLWSMEFKVPLSER